MARGIKNTPVKAAAAKEAAPATTKAQEVANTPEKSAFEQAVAAGYTGTEEQFNDPEFTGAPIAPVASVSEPKVKAVPEKPKAPEATAAKEKSKEPENNGADDLENAFKYASFLGFKGRQSDLKVFIASFKPSKEPIDGTYIVAKPFKDAAKHLQDGENAKKYEVGEDVSYLDAERLEFMLNKGLVTKQ